MSFYCRLGSAVLLSSLCGTAHAAEMISLSPTSMDQNAATTEAAVFPLRSTTTFQAGYAERNVEIDPSTTMPYTAQAGVSGMGAMTITYDAASGKYALKDRALPLSWTTPSRSKAAGGFDVYTRNTTRYSDVVKIFGNAKGAIRTLPIKLSYMSFGYWKHIDKANKSSWEYFFYFGSPTPDASMPKTGSASYKTVLYANTTTVGYGAGTYDVTGTATFNADFAKSSVSTQLSLNRVFETNVTPIGVYNGTASISFGKFFGPLTSGTDPYLVSGAFSGAFFGPSAEEVGYTFYLYRHNPYAEGGATPQLTSESITGVVAGLKSP